jgi:hypothetical protein
MLIHQKHNLNGFGSIRMEADKEGGDEQSQHKDDQSYEDRTTRTLKYEVDDSDDACKKEMSRDTVESADRLVIPSYSRLITKKLAVSRRIAVRISCKIDIAHGVRSYKIEKFVYVVHTSMAG